MTLPNAARDLQPRSAQRRRQRFTFANAEQTARLKALRSGLGAR